MTAREESLQARPVIGIQESALGATAQGAEPGEAIAGVAAMVMAALVAGFFIGRRDGGGSTKISSAGENDFQIPDSAESFDWLPVQAQDWRFLSTRFCPVCFAEYIAGTLACEDCGVDLVEENDVPETDTPITERLVRIPNVLNYLEGHLLRQYLAAYRVPSLVLRNSFGDLLASDLYVFESDVVRAKRLLRQYLSDARAATA